MDKTYKLLDEAGALLRRRGFGQPRVAVILGSGLGDLADGLAAPVAVDYSEIPGFAPSTVPGHAGRLVFGAWEGVSVVAMQGRYHGYEGYSQRQIAFALWTLAALGAKSLLVTNAAGGLNPEFRPGDLMLIADHINFTGGNPPSAPIPNASAPRFSTCPGLTPRRGDCPKRPELYSRALVLAVTGPCYETPAEIRAPPLSAMPWACPPFPRSSPPSMPALRWRGFPA